jgi:flavin reductase (DIM6/NTAB) family NADH-FMN oxidoreductase RutF
LSEAFVDSIDAPVFVLTVHADGEDSGCLAGFVTQCSIDPVRFAVCVSKVNRTFRVADRSQAFAVHLLGADQGDVASLFGETSGDTVDKFAQVRWSRGATGVPILADCAAFIEGPTVAQTSGGDHQVFIIGVSGGGPGRHKGLFMLSDAAGFDAGHPA